MFKANQILENKYKIIEQIGSGGGGTVYKAFQMGLNRYVAIKQIKEEVCGIINERGEADILKKLKNDYIPSVIDFIVDGGQVYTVMEFVEGNSFQKLLDDGKTFSQAKALKYARQLCEAAAYLHSQEPPIIHSDIKPANVMLTPDDNICLIDYNISLIVNGSESAVGVSDGYSPPEQYGLSFSVPEDNNETLLDVPASDEEYNDAKTLLDRVRSAFTKTLIDADQTRKNNARIPDNSEKYAPKIDKRSDIYSIGAAIYHIVSGKKPEISTGDVTPINVAAPGISESFAAIIDKAMRKDPEKRFDSAAKMLKALNDLRRFDKRYKKLLARQEIAAVIVIAAMAASCLTVAGGYFRIGSETEELYENYVLEITNANFDNAQIYFNMAVDIFPDRAEAYENMAKIIYDSGEYALAEEFINDVLDGRKLYIGENCDNYSRDKLYYILGKCYFETGEFDLSAAAFEKAALENSGENEYYCDYAAALARCGKTEKAEEILEIAVQMGLSDERIFFVRGEIEYALKNYEKCIENLTECVNISEDQEIKYRAFLICANAYSELYKADPEIGGKRIDLLISAAEELPLEKTMPFYEMLAQAYVDEAQKTGDRSYYASAIGVYEKINALGWGYSGTDYSLIRLYRLTGNYAYAKEYAKGRLEDGEDYELYKLLAFIELDIQDGRDNRERDYGEFSAYYEKARELCADSEDFEMQRLDEAYEKIKKRTSQTAQTVGTEE